MFLNFPLIQVPFEIEFQLLGIRRIKMTEVDWTEYLNRIDILNEKRNTVLILKITNQIEIVMHV